MSWKLNGKQINSIQDFSIEPYGFIYEITQISTGKKYIGKKKIRTTNNKESNWLSYYGSSKTVKFLIKKLGKQDFSRKILYLAPDSKTLATFENLILTKKKVLENTNFFNRNIAGKFFS